MGGVKVTKTEFKIGIKTNWKTENISKQEGWGGGRGQANSILGNRCSQLIVLYCNI